MTRTYYSLFRDETTDPTETAILRQILVAVTGLRGACFSRYQVGLFRTMDGRIVSVGIPGFADIIGCYRGRGVAIEVKKPRGKTTRAGKLRKNQRDFRAAWERAGGLHIKAECVEDALTALADI